MIENIIYSSVAYIIYHSISFASSSRDCKFQNIWWSPIDISLNFDIQNWSHDYHFNCFIFYFRTQNENEDCP